MRASYWLLVRRVPGGGPPALRCLRGTDGETIFAVYAAPEAAEAHALIMGREHSVVEGSAADLAAPLAEFASADDLVALNPPLAMEGGEPQPVRAEPVGRFLERLREEG